MKKLAALLLALALCLGVAAAETADIIGTWYLSEVVVYGESCVPAALGLDITMTLGENETATTVFGEETMVSYWRKNGDEYVTPLSDGLLTFKPQDGRLVGQVMGSEQLIGAQMIFIKTIELGEAKTDATMADYNGKWNATMVDFLGMQIPIDDMGTTMEITIADGKVMLKETVEGAEPMTEEGNVTVENGMAAITVPGSNEAVSVQLYEGDVLMWVNQVAEDVNMTIYFEKVAE